MKKQLIITIAAALVATMFIYSACNKTNQTDLVNGISAVHPIDSAHMGMLDALKDIPDNQKMAYLDQHWPNLKHDVVLNAVASGYIPQKPNIDSVVFTYGSGRGKAHNTKKEYVAGKFENQLIANIYMKGSNQPLVFFVRCTNGLVEPTDVSIKRIGVATNFEFTIEKGKGIATYIGSDDAAISIAEQFNRPLFKGRNTDQKNRITPNEARKLNTNTTPITVLVYPGDYFNLATGTYKPAN